MELKLKYKPRYLSKTYGFGAALLLLGGAVLGLPELKAMVETLPAEYQAGALFVVGLLTWVLRELTKGPVGADPSAGSGRPSVSSGNGGGGGPSAGSGQGVDTDD